MRRGQRPEKRLPAQLAAVNRPAAGSDSRAPEHWVAGPPASAPQPVRRCGTCTADREARAEWRRPWGVPTVVRESTGGYWSPLFELREARGVVEVVAAAREGPRARRAGPRVTGRTVSGCRACPPTPYWLPPCGPRSKAGCCVAACARAPGWPPLPANLSSLCQRR